MLCIKNIETKILKSLVCGVIFGFCIVAMLGLISIIGLYFDIFVKSGAEYVIKLFLILSFIGPLLNEIINIILQRRKFYIINEDSITIGSKSYLNMSEDIFPFKNISIKVRFENVFCYESIELYVFSEKMHIEKSELSKEDYMKIKDALLEKVTNISS